MAIPKLFVTLTSPVAPFATIAVIPVAESIVNEDAATPPKSTAATLVKLDPLIVTLVPAIPDVGANELIDGDGPVLIAFFKIEIVKTSEFPDVISGFSSWSRSATAMEKGFLSTAKSM